MIVLIGGLKRGTGKSTVAVNLAVIRAVNGHDVLIVDTNKQATASMWASVRDEAHHSPRVACIQKFGKQLHVELKALAEKYETVIVDSGDDSVEFRASLVVADCCYTPIRASQLDAWTIERLESIASEAKLVNPGLKISAFVNSGSTNSLIKEIDEVRDLLAEYKTIGLAESVIRDRIAFRKSAPEGKGVCEMTPCDPKAVAEIENLYAEIFIKPAKGRTAKPRAIRATRRPASAPKPYEGGNPRLLKPVQLRLPEPLWLKFKYLMDHTPRSMHAFALTAVEAAIEKKIEELEKAE